MSWHNILTFQIYGDTMKKKCRKFAVLVIFMSLPFLFACGDNSKDKTGGKESEAQKQAAVQKETQSKPQPQTLNQAKPKSMLPERLINLGLSDAQMAQCEAAYQEIFTPDIIAQRMEMSKSLRSMEKDSQEYINLQNEIKDKFNPLYAQFNKKLWSILTKEQQDKYFVRKENQQKDNV
jgi:hypothetical protein